MLRLRSSCGGWPNQTAQLLQHGHYAPCPSALHDRIAASSQYMCKNLISPLMEVLSRPPTPS